MINVKFVSKFIFFVCFLIISLDVRFSKEQQQTLNNGGILSTIATFNFMNCMDFARHMSSTAERFGLISSTRTGADVIPVRRRIFDRDYIKSVLPFRLFMNRILSINHRMRQADPIGAGTGGAIPSQGGLIDTFQNLFNQILNIGDSNVLACNQRPKLTACTNIDEYLTSIFPEWWFNLKITDNANYLTGQLTNHRYHALFEAGMKAYKCFCQC